MLIAAIPLAFVNMIGTVIAIFYIEDLGRKYIMIRTIPFCILGMFGMSLGIYFTYFTSFILVG